MIDWDVEHVTDIIINYDYLIASISQMENEVKDNQMNIANKNKLINVELSKTEIDIEYLKRVFIQ